MLEGLGTAKAPTGTSRQRCAGGTDADAVAIAKLENLAVLQVTDFHVL